MNFHRQVKPIDSHMHSCWGHQMQFGNFVKIISSFTHWIFQESSMYSNQPLESEMQRKSLLLSRYFPTPF